MYKYGIEVRALRGAKLVKGDTIGIIAPAGIETEENIEKGIGMLKDLGFNIKKGKHIYDKWGYFAGRDEDRAQDINDMFADSDVKMLLCIRGGYGAMRLLPYIDFKKIRKNPKIFMGYSDITILLNYLFEKEGLITFHGPMLNSRLNIKETQEAFFRSLSDGNGKYSIKNPTNKVMASNMEKSVEGRIVGGNLSLICSSLGTNYEIITRNRILFIEEVDEEPYKVDRMLTQLLLARKLQECRGFILGQFTNCETEKKENKFSIKEVIENRILRLNKPTLINFMSGHEDPKLILPIGAKAKLNCKDLSVDIIEAVCR